MNTYETVFIMNPVLSEDQVKETVNKFTKQLESEKAKITHQESWGLKKLNYSIQKKKTGFYHMLEYQADGEIIKNIEVEFQRDERVLRWLTVRLDKYAIDYAERRKNKKKSNTEEKNS